MMSLTQWSWIFLVLYISVMIGIGIYAQRQIKHADDFATARGAYGPFFFGACFCGLDRQRCHISWQPGHEL